jgi:hypothetical protein
MEDKIDLQSTAASSSSTVGNEVSMLLSARLRRIYRSDHLLNADAFESAASEPLCDLVYKQRNMQCHGLRASIAEVYNVCGLATFHGLVAFDRESFVEEVMYCLQVSAVMQNKEFCAFNVMIL